jgi:secreted PhoX family phosphatase
VTDGAPEAAGVADGVYGADTVGHGRALTRCFYQAPTGAEVCGPIFTPDDRTFFLAVQHPGEDRGSSFEEAPRRAGALTSRMACRSRPAIVAITKKGGGTIGS